MNQQTVQSSRSEKNGDFFQRKQLKNTKPLPIRFIETIFPVFILIFGMTCIVSASEKEGPDKILPFTEGERVVFLGDSITQGGNYIYNILLFEALRHPNKVGVMLNAGISGDTATGGFKRLGYDVLAKNPDRVFIMFGMNDVNICLYKNPKANSDSIENARIKTAEKYKINLTAIVDALQKAGKKVVLITPTPYDSYSDAKAVNYLDANDIGLTSFAGIVREIAKRENVPYIELHKPMTELIKKFPQEPIIRQDRVHPLRAGHLIMTAIILKAIGEDSVVASVEINAAKSSTQSKNATIENLKANSSNVSFLYTPKTLPYPVSADYKAVDKIYPLTKIMNMEILKISGLANGEYELLADKKLLGKFTTAQLADGINLALLDTPSQTNAARVKKAVDQIKNIQSKQRNVVAMERLLANRGVNLENESLVKEAIARHLAELKSKKSGYLNYYTALYDRYLKYRPNIEKYKKQLNNCFRKLSLSFNVTPYTITVKTTGN